MSDLLYIHCQSCGERLTQRRNPYCQSCNLRLAYQAMPFLLGALLLGGFPLLQPIVVDVAPVSRHLVRGYDDENALFWE